jgi:hypothetical protein
MSLVFSDFRDRGHTRLQNTLGRARINPKLRHRLVLLDAPDPRVRIAIVTCGAGASTGFAIGEEVISSLLDRAVIVCSNA